MPGGAGQLDQCPGSSRPTKHRWLLRSRDRGPLDEGGIGGLGRRQQPFPSRDRQGDRRPGRGRRDNGQARGSPQASGGIERALRASGLGRRGWRTKEQPPSRAEKPTGSQDQRKGRGKPQPISTASRSTGMPSAVGKRRRGRKSAASARRSSRRRRRRWTRCSGSTKSEPRLSKLNGRQSRSGSRPKMPVGKARRTD